MATKRFDSVFVLVQYLLMTFWSNQDAKLDMRIHSRTKQITAQQTRTTSKPGTPVLRFAWGNCTMCSAVTIIDRDILQISIDIDITILWCYRGRDFLSGDLMLCIDVRTAQAYNL